MSEVLQQAVIPGLPSFHWGKVRDTFDLGPNKLLTVATDRVSAFDAVLPTLIPKKGKVLNLMSAFWFEKTKVIVPNHLVAVINNVGAMKEWLGRAGPDLDYLVDRSMVVRKAERLPVECVVRGFLSGSAWSAYQKDEPICGIRLPSGLQESAELPEPIFTPTTKAETGHDQPLTMKKLKELVGSEQAEEIRIASLLLYRFARKYAAGRGIIIADTKFEFGLIDGRLTLIDELLTPDSSRFWDAQKYQPGRSQNSFDKQPLRDWLVVHGWKGEGQPPQLPSEVVKATTERYLEAYRRLVGKDLPI